MSEREQLKRKCRRFIGSVFIGLVLFSGSLEPSYMAEAKVSVVSETGQTIPSEGSVWVYYDLTTAHKGFSGNLIIRKRFEDSFNSSGPTGEYVLETQIPLKLSQDEFKGRVKYFLGREEANMSNQWHYDYEVKDSLGNSIGTGSLGSYKVTTSGMEATVLILGRDSGETKVIKTRIPSATVMVKQSLEGEDKSFLESYKTLVLSHEEALSLSPEEQENLLKQTASGARLILISDKAHSKKNFIEKKSGQIFSESGMTNLKADLNLLALKNDSKDHWLETAKTPTGKTIHVFGYGKGYIYQLGYNPFLIGEQAGESFEKAMFQTLLYQTSMNLKMNSSNYGLPSLARQLPENYLPSFGLSLVAFGIVITASAFIGMYLVRSRRLTSGMLIAVASGSVICLIFISFSGLVSGYRGSVIGEYSYNKFYENQVESIAYVGIKSNKKVATFVTRPETEIWLGNNVSYSEERVAYINEVSEENTWKIPRSDKWQMDLVTASGPVNLPMVEDLVKDFSYLNGSFKGTLENGTEKPFENALLLADGNAYKLGRIEAGQSLDLSTISGPIALKNQEGNYWEDTAALFNEESKSLKGLNAQQFKLLMDMALNSGEATKGIKLYFFTTAKDNPYSLKGEKPLKTSLALNQYELESPSVPLTRESEVYSLTDIQVLSGFVHKMTYGLSGEIQMASTEPSNSFMGRLPLTETMKKSNWSVNYLTNQFGKVSFFNQKTGVWDTVESGKVLSGQTLADQYRDQGNFIWIRIDGTSTYVNLNDLTIRKGGQ